jgi:hypothetical protein
MDMNMLDGSLRSLRNDVSYLMKKKYNISLNVTELNYYTIDVINIYKNEFFRALVLKYNVSIKSFYLNNSDSLYYVCYLYDSETNSHYIIDPLISMQDCYSGKNKILFRIDDYPLCDSVALNTVKDVTGDFIQRGGNNVY